MRCLLDTCAFIWLDQDPARFSKVASAALRDPANELLVSHVSLWEAQAKIASGKLTLSAPLPQVVRDQFQRNGVGLLALTLGHIYNFARLPRLHPDSVDRLLIAQAQTENLSIVTSDGQFPQYGVPVVW